MFIELENDDLHSIVDNTKHTLVMYGAGWCGNCKLLKPKFKKLAAEYDIPFVYVDADKSPKSRSLTNLSNLPTISAFHQTNVVAQDEGNKIDVITSVLENIK